MRIKLQGKSSLERIEEALTKLAELQPEGTTWHGVNIYLTLKDADGEPIELVMNGEVLDVLLVNDTEKPKRVPVKQRAPAEVIDLHRKTPENIDVSVSEPQRTVQRLIRRSALKAPEASAAAAPEPVQEEALPEAPKRIIRRSAVRRV